MRTLFIECLYFDILVFLQCYSYLIVIFIFLQDRVCYMAGRKRAVLHGDEVRSIQHDPHRRFAFTDKWTILHVATQI